MWRERRENPDLVSCDYYVLVAVIKKELELEASLYTCLQILSVSILEKNPYFMRLSARSLPIRPSSDRQPVESLRLLTGQ